MQNNNKKIKIIFIGTADFGAPSLEALLNNKKVEVPLIITQPDKKQGRKQILAPPPIKQIALKYNIPVLQPDKIKNAYETINNLRADIILLIAYAQKIPIEILEAPKFGSINLHGSLLPRCRGAACIQKPIIDGDKETGVTVMKMDEDFDTGPILDSAKISIEKNDTTGIMFNKLSELGAKILLPTIQKYIAGEIKPIPQNHAKADYVCQLTKKDGRINWQITAAEIERFIRAMTPWPSAYSYLHDGSMLKILEVEHESININKHQPGAIFCHEDKICIQCGKNALTIKKLQLAGKKPITGKEFLCGHNNLIGQILK